MRYIFNCMILWFILIFEGGNMRYIFNCMILWFISIFEGRKHPDLKEDDEMYQMGAFWDV